MNKITRITVDLRYQSYYAGAYYNEPVIIVQRGGSYKGTTKTYKATSTAMLWVQRYIAHNGGAIKINNDLSATWFHNIDPMYTDGYTFESEFVTMAVLPNWKLQITLNDEGRKIISDYTLDDRGLIELEYELLEDALCNGWTLDPDDDGRMFISLDAGIDDDGNYDIHPGELGWSDDVYALRSYVDALLEHGSVVFTPYYFGEIDLIDQGSI